MVFIHVKKYEHFNRAMGKYITSKAHYEKEMREGGFVPSDVGDQQAEDWSWRTKKKYKASKDAHDIAEVIKDKADKKGNVKVPEKVVDKLKEMGMSFDQAKIDKAIKDQEDIAI